ncbi:MAG: DUF2924 domain-containing protein [Rhodospirillaceae bacterium]|nr:DUF2924 domain-containing protein [Rhodospirillaceae bacterium]MBT7487863.1 DUF2924 domain-containing protein [Rhodospirillales bacterium]MBT7769284.1 DUF2924 domain-containing protein [Rhodospirillales bacterium]
MTDKSVDQIENMDRGALVALWKELFPEPLPLRASMPFLRRVLAFEVQCSQSEGLPLRFIERLQKHAKGSKPTRSKYVPKPGGRLLREWNGFTHVVDVADGHYVWKGQQYQSLSAIARAITGAHWSGPRFFGLKGARS